MRRFEDSGKILAVSRPGSGARGDFSLQSELRNFTSIYDGGQPRAVVELHVRLVRSVDGRVVAAHLFREVEPAAGTEVASVVESFARALDRTRDRMIGWTLATGEAHEARRAKDPAAAHGAGRRMSRTKAKQLFTWDAAQRFLRERGVTLLSAGCPRKGGGDTTNGQAGVFTVIGIGPYFTSVGVPASV